MSTPGAHRTAGLEHDREAEDGAEQVGTGVAEHEPLAEVGRQQAGRRADHGREGQADGADARRERDRDVGQQAHLDRAAWCPVEEVAEVRRQGDERGVREETAAAHLARAPR